MTKFEIREVINLPRRVEFILAGRVLEGEVRAGMSALISTQAELYWSLTVNAIEYIDRISVGESLVGLVCMDDDDQAAEICSEFCPPGTVIEVQATEQAA